MLVTMLELAAGTQVQLLSFGLCVDLFSFVFHRISLCSFG